MVPLEEVLSSLALNDLLGLGPVRFRQLIETFGSASSAIASAADWGAIPGFIPSGEFTSDIGPALARARVDEELARRENVQILFAHQGPYPTLLRTISGPPPVLYVLGKDLCAYERAVAIVGSRRSTYYGDKMARQLSEGLAAAGVITVSGLARGIDTRVHTATINAGGKTWAVVGSGLSKLYPPENRELAQKISEKGAVISEFPMATKPHPSNFPRRNRIIAGLSQGTVVVEGSVTSGSLITARLAAAEGRDVFAVPGPATSPLSRAPHLLIKQGAMMVESVEDILSELGWNPPMFSPAVEGSPETVDPCLAALTDVPVSREEFLARSGMDAGAAASKLVELELNGLIKTLPGGKLVRA